MIKSKFLICLTRPFIIWWLLVFWPDFSPSLPCPSCSNSTKFLGSVFLAFGHLLRLFIFIPSLKTFIEHLLWERHWRGVWKLKKGKIFFCSKKSSSFSKGKSFQRATTKKKKKKKIHCNTTQQVLNIQENYYTASIPWLFLVLHLLFIHLQLKKSGHHPFLSIHHGMNPTRG